MIVFCAAMAALTGIAFYISERQIKKRIEKGLINEYMKKSSSPEKGGDSLTVLVLLLVSSLAVSFIYYKSNPGIVEMISMVSLTALLSMAANFDLRTWTIPNYVPFILIGIRACLLGYEMIKGARLTGKFVDSIFALVLCLVIPLLASLLQKGSLGSGDIKLLAAVGFSMRTIPACYIMLIGLICAIAVRYFYHIFQKEKRSGFFPLGPYIYVGFVGYIIFLS